MNDKLSPDPDVSSRLAASRAAFAALQPKVAAGEPWPLAEDFSTGPEASWGPREVLAHTAEMLTYWLGEFERLVEAGRGTGDGQPFGRLGTDTLRSGVLERDRTLPLRELFDRIDAFIGRWERRTAAGSPAEAAAIGQHPRLGEMTAGQARDQFVLDHLEDHVAQLQRLLGLRGPAA
jgi:hypothetical protein